MPIYPPPAWIVDGSIASYGGSAAIGANPAQSGALRLPNAGWVTARNQANSADLNILRANSGNEVEITPTLRVAAGIYGEYLVLDAASVSYIEIGRSTLAATPFIDFHSSGGSTDYDVRLGTSGGSAGGNGRGLLSIEANVTHLPYTVAGAKALSSAITVATGSSGINTTAYRPWDFVTTISATDLTLGTLISGVRSGVTIGAGGAAVVVTAHDFTADMVIQGCGDALSEYANYMSALRADIGTGFTQTAGPVGRYWATDFNLHGPVGVQANLLSGINMFLNNYYNGSPTNGSWGQVITTDAGSGGGSSATHQAATTYPIDYGFAIMGRSTGSGRGFTTAMRLGGDGGAWGVAGSRFGTALELLDWETYGLYISGRYAGATGSAIVVAAGAGPVLYGGVTAFNSTESRLELHGATNADATLLHIGNTSGTRRYSISLGNGVGTMGFSIVGAAGGMLTGTAASDGVIQHYTAGKAIHLGGTTKVISVTTDNKAGFFAATPVVRPTSTTDLRQALIDLGLYTTGGASPLDLNGGDLTADAVNATTLRVGTSTTNGYVLTADASGNGTWQVAGAASHPALISHLKWGG